MSQDRQDETTQKPNEEMTIEKIWTDEMEAWANEIDLNSIEGLKLLRALKMQ